MSSPPARIDGCGAWREHEEIGWLGSRPIRPSRESCRARDGGVNWRLGSAPATRPMEQRPRRRAAARCAVTSRHALAMRLGMRFRQSSAQVKNLARRAAMPLTLGDIRRKGKIYSRTVQANGPVGVWSTFRPTHTDAPNQRRPRTWTGPLCLDRSDRRSFVSGLSLRAGFAS